MRGVLLSGSRGEARCKFMKRKGAVCGDLIGGELMSVPPTPPPVFWQRARIRLKKEALVKIERAGNCTRVRNVLTAKEMINLLSVL